MKPRRTRSEFEKWYTPKLFRLRLSDYSEDEESNKRMRENWEKLTKEISPAITRRGRVK